MTSGLNARAYDLSAVAAAAKMPPLPPGATFVAEVTDTSLEGFLQLSAKHPVVLELYSPRAQTQQLSDTLIELANAAGGAYLLGRMNVDQYPQMAQALQVQAVPFVIGFIAGRPLPMFQGTRPKEEVQAVLAELLNMSAKAGIVERATPVSIDENAGPDPRFEAADAAIEAGDFATAVVEFDKLLAQTPSDTEAKAGRAQASLLLRLQNVADPNQVLITAAAAPADHEAQLIAADVELAQGLTAAAFTRLVETIRRTSGSARESVRIRLLELFETRDADDPDVNTARRDLMTALF